MKKLFKGISFLLVFVLVFSLSGVISLAAEVNPAGNMIMEDENQTELVEEPTSETTDQTTGDEQTNIESGKENSLNQPEKNEGQTTSATNVADTYVQQLSYVYVDEQVVHVPEIQNIAVGLKDESVHIKTATLKYRSIINGAEYSLEANKIVDNTALFTQSYEVEPIEDSYQIESLLYTVEGEEEGRSVLLADEGIEAKYQVTMEAEVPTENSEPIAEVVAYSVDSEGNTVEKAGDSIEDVVETVLDEAGVEEVEDSNTMVSGKQRAIAPATYSLTSYSVQSRNKDLVVAISAGHDAQHIGASANNLREEELTLKVARYCKAELEEYNGVRVYMTRETEACPYPGTSTSQDNTSRIDAAVANGADIYVDIHFNSGGGTGAEVFYPNTSYDASISQEGKEAAEAILAQLEKLGLTNRGAKIRNATDGEVDGQGNKADYYTTNNYCKEKGIPGIIVEHAFLDRAEDAAFVKSEANLKALGIADATGIASKYNLSKEKASVQITEVNDFNGTFKVVANGLRNGANVKAFVWGTGQNSTDVCYTLQNTGNGKYEIVVDKKNHKNFSGNYYVAVYYGNSTGVDQPELCSAYAILNASEAKTEGFEASGKVSCNVKTTINNPPASNVKVKYAVWPAGSSAKWYFCDKINDETWSKTIDLNDFKVYGKYYCDTYVEYPDGRNIYLNSKTFQVDKPTITSIGIENFNNAKGTFDVVLRGVNVPLGIQKLQVAVWPAGKNLNWYTFTRNSDGTYVVSVDAKNYNYEPGEYYADVYLADGFGKQVYMGGSSCSLTLTNATVVAKDVSGGKQTDFQIEAANVSSLYGVKGVKFAIWREGNPVKWYDASQDVTGVWRQNVKVKDFGLTGKYYVDVYGVSASNQMRYCGGTKFDVNAATCLSVKVSNQNNQKGTFSIVAEGINVPSGVAEVKIPVWAKGNPPNWYVAQKQSDGSYKVDVDIRNHQSILGNYYGDVYVKDNNGSTSYVGGNSCIMSLPRATVSATDQNGQQKQFLLKAANVASALGVKKVEFAVWRAGSAPKWYEAKQDEYGAWNCSVNISDFKLVGQYYTDVYVTTIAGSVQYAGGTQFNVDRPQVSTVSFSNMDVNKGTFSIIVSGITSTSGVEKIEVPIWLAGQKVVWYTGIKQGEGIYKVDVNISNHDYLGGKYYADVYITDGNHCKSYVGGANQLFNYNLYPIMGENRVTVNQMVSYYNSMSPIGFPAGDLSKGGAATLEQFCQIYYEEAQAEGVSAEVAFAQSMLETGFLRFGGDVNIEQFNFAGMGATGNGNPGHSFSSVRIGIRAQIQHLKCYGSTLPLNQEKVDPRWTDFLRGKAIYVEWLSIPNNPYGTGWAADSNYGNKLIGIISTIKSK